MQPTKKTMTEEAALRELSALCAKGEHCRHDLLEKMRRWQLTEEAQARILARLAGERYVDDARYARAFVSDKIRYNKWGRRKVEQALWQKHIDKDIVEEVLGEVPDEEYISILRPLLKQRQKALPAKGSPTGGATESARLIRFALSRGFTMDVIRQCIDVEDEDEFLD